MANEISFTEWQKGDILTAERLNNIQNVVQKAGKALGIFNDDNNTSNGIQFSGASANVGSVSMDAHGLTVGNSNGIYTTTLYGTLQTDTISGITNSNVNIGNLIVGKYENNAYDGTAIFNIAKVEFKNNIEIDNDIIVGHPTVNAQTNSISQYNGEAIFNTAKTTLHGQTVIDSEVNTDLIDLLIVGHTSGSGANIRYYGKAIFNTSETEFHDIVSNGNISINLNNVDGRIIARNAYFGWQDTNVDNDDPYYGEAEFKTHTNTFYGETTFIGPTDIKNLTAPAATTTSAGLMSATDKMIIEQAVTGITLNNSEIPKRVGGLVPLDNYILPSFSGLSDGIYILQMTLTDGNPTYEWVLKSEGE